MGAEGVWGLKGFMGARDKLGEGFSDSGDSNGEEYGTESESWVL